MDNKDIKIIVRKPSTQTSDDGRTVCQCCGGSNVIRAPKSLMSGGELSYRCLDCNNVWD